MEEKVFSIFIKNFPLNTTEQQLSEKFNQYGKVKSVRIMTTDTGQCRGFGFLDYENEEDMNRAIENANETDFNGSKIKVERARHLLGDPPRQKRQVPMRQMQDYRYMYRDPRGYRDYPPDFRRYPDPYAQPPNNRYRDDLERPSYRNEMPRYRNDYPMNPGPYRREMPGYYDGYREERYERMDYYQQRPYRNYSEPMNDSTRPIRRIRDDTPPSQRRIVDDSPPPPPPRRIVDDDDTPPKPQTNDSSNSNA